MTEVRIPLKMDFGHIVKGYADSGYDPLSALCELIDNAIGANAEKVNIDFTYGAGNQCTTITITDDGSGIAFDELDVLMAPSQKKTEGKINEHGSGMKAAIAFFGEDSFFNNSFGGIESYDGVEHYRIKAVEGNELVVDKFPYKRKDTGTCIIINVNNGQEFKTSANSGTQTIIPFLGRKYALLLENKELAISLSFTRESDGKITERDVSPNHPPFLHIDGVSKRPCANIDFTTPMATKGTLVIGRFNADLSNSERRGWPTPKGQNGGMDIIMHGRAIILQDQGFLSGLNVTHPKFNYLIGRIILKSYIPTTPNKMGFRPGEEFSDVANHIADIWKKQNITQQFFPDTKTNFSESKVRNKLKSFLEKEIDAMTGNNIWTDVKKEQATDVNLNMDVAATHISGNKAVFEVKIKPISAQDVNQLVGYMIATKVKHGYFVGPEISGNAETQIENWNNTLKDPVSITFWDYNGAYKKILS